MATRRGSVGGLRRRLEDPVGDSKQNGKKRGRHVVVATFDLLAELGRDNFEAHDQGGKPTCTAHAVTVAHEILIGKKLETKDLVTGKEEDEEGTTVSKLSRILVVDGQRELNRKGGKGLCHRLRFKKIDNEILIVKKTLKRGLPVIVGVVNFRSDVTDLTLRNSTNAEPGKHSIVITGYSEDGESEGGGYFTFLNSHGSRYGRNGFGTISYGFYLAYAIETNCPVKFRKKR
eukprot:CAMPEP_0114505656 /NCGR_PEP_ID=MMETSP0109-20121206/10975_1 /TAXON_ID=29199 /ORGANISM="Chlorarachnion reptans, Strain CCCM449" /LENGTH=230 /DNA_ID=CAMNT_0001684121 /DNA_START=244 /DNA_END=936 /DNA_ORIENTATION=+